MEKLTFYALSAPEKLDRIGAYLSERLSRDVARHRYGHVCIAMEALDQLLMACHCQSINLFVESFLKMVRKLLESDKPNLQILGTNSFVKFANIEEDTPSYHRSYDFFVSRFSEMCHSSFEDPDVRTKIRMAGIKGLQGVVRKTVNDELQANIWDPQHMDKIVPSLLFNLQSGEGTESRSPSPLQASEKEKESPAELTERCFRELLGRAAYGNIKNAVTPVLMHLDNHSLWEGKTFAVRCFKIIMYSIQGTRMIQIMLLKSLVQVTAGFQTTNMLTALPSSFLEPLLSFSLTEDPEVRLLVLTILLSLIDRHDNRPKFSTISIITDISVLKLKVDKCSRQDNLFMKKHGQQLYRHIYLGCKEQSSGRQHYETLFTLLALLSMELANEEVVVDLIRLALALQDLALSTDESMPVYNRCAVHALAAAYLNLICQLTTIPAFCQHIHEVIEVRQKETPYLLPEDVFIESPKLPSSLEKIDGGTLFLQSKITEVLGGSGYNTERLATPYVPQYTDEDRLSKRKSIGETISLQVEVESRNSPEKEERTPAEEITFETLKNAIVDSVGMEEQERERRRQVVEKFQKAPFEEIAAHCGARATLLQSKLNQIFEITIRPPPSPSGTISSGYGQSQSRSVPVYEMKFPDLCVY
ncbi:protein EFR3 homolog B [Diretmus argenteus]